MKVVSFVMDDHRFFRIFLFETYFVGKFADEGKEGILVTLKIFYAIVSSILEDGLHET